MANLLDHKRAAELAYRHARTLMAMRAEQAALYNAYQGPEEDRLAGGKYALGRLVGIADQEHGEALKALGEASAALVRFADLLEAVTLATEGASDWEWFTGEVIYG